MESQEHCYLKWELAHSDHMKWRKETLIHLRSPRDSTRTICRVKVPERAIELSASADVSFRMKLCRQCMRRASYGTFRKSA